MEIGTPALAFLAGLLSILSPCVLPLLPIVVATALDRSKGGPLALAAGVGISFTIVGLFVATIGFAIGLDGDLFRRVAALGLVAVGTVLLVPQLQERFALAAGPMANWVERFSPDRNAGGFRSQFVVGLLLGAAWAPCVGPTLGAASLLAAQREHLVDVGLVMMAFGVGASLPLALMGLVSRSAFQRWRDGLRRIGQGGRFAFGALLIGIGALIFSGLDKQLEAFLVQASPEWLTNLTTQF